MRFKLIYIKLFYLVLMVVLFSNHSDAQQLNSYSLFLTANTSDGISDKNLLKKWKEESENSKNKAFLLLGNIYNPKEKKFSCDLYIAGESSLLIAPGEKEWANGSFSGKKMIGNIENQLRKHYKGNIYMPDAACPGPKVVKLNNNLVVILIDTHWWVHKYDRRFAKCDIDTRGDVLLLIEDAIRKHYPTKHVVIAGHHSLKSYGNSDGYFSLKQRIFQAPYTWYRRILGTRKDNHHPDFKEFRDTMLSMLEKYPDVIYVSGADKNLQYFNLNNTHFINSGSFVQTEYVRAGKAEYVSSEMGFARLNFSNEGNCQLIFTNANGDIFQKNLYNKTFIDEEKKEFTISQLSDSMTIKASNKYNIPQSAYLMMGENYRTIWNTPVKVAALDIVNSKGGLHIVKRGGGQQTHSLILEDKNGRQYVMRSFEKYVEGFLPDELDNTIAVDIVQDQISASNPYATLVVAELAEYAGVFHTNPEIVYGPDDPRFGIYRQDIAGQLYIFEERPDGDRSDVASFGYSKDIISTDEMIEKILDKKDHSIVEDAYLRARLFDILINDWDRHGDQWRWASFKNENKTIYKPIPRDRDQAFFVNEGIIPRIASSHLFVPKIQGFDEFTENINGFSFNARYLDRTFLTQSDWKNWVQQIDSLKILLTPERIDNAVLSFPKEIIPLCSNETAEILKIRLENLEAMTKDLYLSLAKEVNITGSNEEDLFEIEVTSDTTIQITGYYHKSKKEEVIYSRTFYASETKKIRIYGFDKKDCFVVKGSYKNKIDLNIIGGDNEDKIIFETTKVPRFITIYDDKNTDISKTLNSRIIHIYNDKELGFNWRNFEYDIVYPGLFTGYNQDDGAFVGGGPIIYKYSRYYRQKYKIFANYAFLTKAFNLQFSGNRFYPLKRFEIDLIVDIKSPNYVNNYFGLGNESKWQDGKSDIEYYWVRMQKYYIKTEFVKILDKNGIQKASLGIFYKSTKIEESADRFISNFLENDLNSTSLLLNSFAGFSLLYNINTIPKEEMKMEEKFGGSNIFRTKGIYLKTEFAHFIGLNSNSPDFSRLSGELTSYISFSQRPRVVYAVRFGGEKLFGDYVFNEAAKLGQKDNLRGFRHTRFYGDANIYMNIEMRIRVKQFKTYILNGTAGLVLFNDIGRVWLDSENSSMWHDGYGIGLWWSPFDMAVLTTTYSRSTEENLINISLNYLF